MVDNVADSGKQGGRMVLRFWVLGVLCLMAVACSGESGNEPTTTVGEASTTTAADGSPRTTSTTPTTPSPDDDIGVSGRRLGFATDLYDVPLEAHDPANGLPEIGDTGAFIDLGVEAGVWTEVEGVRAVMSVLMGELDPTSIPAMDLLTNPHHGEVLHRAEDLMENPSIDEAQRADLRRLTAFFFEDIPDSVPIVELQRSFALASYQSCIAGSVSLPDLYGTPGEPGCFTRYAKGQDEV